MILDFQNSSKLSRNVSIHRSFYLPLYVSEVFWCTTLHVLVSVIEKGLFIFNDNNYYNVYYSIYVVACIFSRPRQ